MLELNKDNFDSEIMQGKGTFLVDFWSESCDKCKELMPDIEALDKEFGDRITFGKLDIKGSRRLAMAQGVMGIPSLVFYQDGEKKAHLSGEELEVAEIRKAIEEYL